MPKAKRSPIDYTPQFGAGIFRPKDTIEQELAELEGDTSGEAGSDLDAASAAPLGTEPDEGSNGKPAPRQISSLRTTVRTNERTNERERVRHSFDIWQDQLLGLSEIQAERFSRAGRKPKLGELVQEALDAYIAKERKRTNVRTNER
jgi:hypothetical protein